MTSVVLNEAERRVNAGTASMLVNVGPILIAVLAGVLLHEWFPRALMSGIVVAFAGVVVIALATSGQGIAAGWGTVLCVVAALAYAGAVVAQKPVLARVSPLQLTWLACTIGALLCRPFAPSLIRELGDAKTSAVGWTVYLGAAPTAIAFTTWAYALARTTAGRLGSTTYLVLPLRSCWLDDARRDSARARVPRRRAVPGRCRPRAAGLNRVAIVSS